jgi:hypothetical protein
VICLIGIHEAMEIILSAICSAPISSENTATDFHNLVDTFSAIFSTNEVLPIAGLAAKIISSPGLNHPDILSSLSYFANTTFSVKSSGFSAIL